MRLQDVTGLGQPVVVAQLQGWPLFWRLAGAAALLIAAGATPFLAAAGVGGMTRDWYLGGLVLLVFGGLWGGLTLVRARNAAAVFEHGVAWARGPVVRCARWDEIASISASRTQNVAYGVIAAGRDLFYYVELRDGEKVKFSNDNTPRVEQIGELIAKTIIPRALAEASGAFSRGEEVSFGAVTIGRDLGVRCRDTGYRWDELGAVEAGHGQFHCHRRGATLGRGTNVPISEIRNFDALWRIIGQELQSRQSDAGGRT